MFIIHYTDNLSVSVYSFLQTIDDSTSTIKGHFTVAEKSNLTNYAMFSITGAHAEHTDHFDVPVSWLSGATSFTDTTEVIVTFARTGDVGDRGFDGSFGATGYDGSVGATGYDGSVGATGYDGSVGATGYDGSFGATGYDGSIGATGYDGSIGADGSQGIRGYDGCKGDTGYNGSVGAAMSPIDIYLNSLFF